MKPITAFFLALMMVWLAYSCQSSHSSAGSAGRGNTGKNYPLRVSFVADYVQVQQTENIALWNLDADSQPRSGRINTTGDGFFLTLRDNTINADLPYYGQRYEFLGVYEEPRIRLKDKSLENVTYGRSADRKILALEFDVHQNTERFHVQLVIMPDQKAYLLVKSAQRQSIRYEGTVASL